MDIVDRLITYRDFTGLTNSQFADKAGIPRPTLSQFLNGRNKRLSDEFTSKLHIAYPDLNILWLLFGEGDMVTSQNIEISEGKISENTSLFDDQDFENEDIDNADYDEKSTPENPTNEILKANSANSSYFDTSRAPHPVISTDPAKKVQSIMVFYSDNSYELFTPAATAKAAN